MRGFPVCMMSDAAIATNFFYQNVGSFEKKTFEKA